MPIEIKHPFQSAKADGPDTTRVQPSNWNAAHAITMATARLIGRTTAGAGDAEEVPVGAGLLLDGTGLYLDPNGTGLDARYYTEAEVDALLAALEAEYIAAIAAHRPVENIPIACSDEQTAITAGTAKVSFHMPYAFTLTEVIAGLTTAQVSGSLFTVDVNENGVSILSTKLTIDNGEETSLTAATPPVISDASLAKGSKITIDVDQIGDATAKGLKVYLVGSRV